ncbi:FHA domain-containing protein FhaB/FipA [Corynebacterium urogenitale]
MQATLLLVAKIGLLLLLWFFIWMTVRAMRSDADRASGLSAAAPVVAAAPFVQNEDNSHNGGGRGFGAFRRAKAPSALTLVSGPLMGTHLELQGYKEVTIGRSQSATLVLEDDFASGRHARLIKRGPDWFLEDLDSRNGTFIGSQRIDQPEKLSAGMEVRIGQTLVRMEG